MPRMDQVELASAIDGLSSGRQGRHVVVQFDRPLEPVERAQLERAGLNLLAYLGNQAFFASFSKAGVAADELSAMPFLSGVYSIEPSWKLDPRMAAGEVPDWAVVKTDLKRGRTVGVYVLFHPDIPLLTEGTSIARRHEGEVRSDLESVNGLVLELPLANVRALAAEDAVQWIEWPLPRLSEINDSNRAITEADIVQATPYGLDGSGVSVLVYDGGTARASHMDFQGRLTVRDTSGLSDHATHVGGTIGGAGAANSTYKGMAPGVTIESYGFEQEGGLQRGLPLHRSRRPGGGLRRGDQHVRRATSRTTRSARNIGAQRLPLRVGGRTTASTGGLIDAIVATAALGGPVPHRLGQRQRARRRRCDIEGYGDYYTTAPPACAKNHITVGALNSNDDSVTSFTSWGPTDDGRLKPDISAPGCQSGGDCGVTSCSSASDAAYTTQVRHVDGVAHGVRPVRAAAAGLPGPVPRRARLPQLDAQDPAGPHGRGHRQRRAGLPDGYGSVRDPAEPSTSCAPATSSRPRWTRARPTPYSCSSATDDPELKVTMAWDDAPGTPNVDPALVNDLDLRVFDPSSQRHYPWTLDPVQPRRPGRADPAPTASTTSSRCWSTNPAPGA